MLQEKNPDQKKLLEQICSKKDKENMVKFMLDCVRNRFHVWNKVSDVEKKLSEAEGWKKAFIEVKKHPPYDSVDLKQSDWTLPKEPWLMRPRSPIPFAFELVTIVGIALPLCAYLQTGNCMGRW